MGGSRRLLALEIALLGVGCGDVSAMGRRDAELVSFDPRPVRAEWLDLTATLVAPGVRPEGCSATRFVDLDGDGLVEMLVPSVDGSVQIHPLRGGQVQARSAWIGHDDQARAREGWRTHGCLLHVQDLDGDGHLDLVTSGGRGALRVRWMRAGRVLAERLHQLPASRRADDVTDVALWVYGGRRWLIAAVSPGEERDVPSEEIDFEVLDGRRVEARGYAPSGHLSAIALDGVGALRDVEIEGPTRCMGGGVTPVGDRVLVGCDFGPQLRVSADAMGTLRVREIPHSYGHGMGIAPVEIPGGRRLYVVSSLGGWLLIPEDLSRVEVLGAVPAVPWEMSAMDLNGDGVADLATQPNGVLMEQWDGRGALFRALFIEGGVPLPAAWGLVSERSGEAVRYRPMYTVAPRAQARMGRMLSLADIDGDGALEQVQFREARGDGGERLGAIVIGRTVIPGAAADTRAVYVPPQPVPTRWRVSCPDGSTRAWWVHPAVGMGGNTQTFYAYSCARP